MKFDCLTGLRPSEAVAPTQLINKRKEKKKIKKEKGREEFSSLFWS
jgi:hypothetical protein